jgi:hypothetical protein
MTKLANDACARKTGLCGEPPGLWIHLPSQQDASEAADSVIVDQVPVIFGLKPDGLRMFAEPVRTTIGRVAFVEPLPFHVDGWPCRICALCNSFDFVEAGVIFLDVTTAEGGNIVVRVERHNDDYPALFSCKESTREVAEEEVLAFRKGLS